MRYIIALGEEPPYSALSRQEALAHVKPRVVHVDPPGVRLLGGKLRRRHRIRGRDHRWEPIWQELWVWTSRPDHPHIADQLMTYIADRKGLDTYFDAHRDKFEDLHHFGALKKDLAAREKGEAGSGRGSRRRRGAVDLPAKALRAGGQEFVLGEWRRFARLSPREQREWATDYIGEGIREPVDVTIHKDGTVDIVDGHHRVMAGYVLGRSVPVAVNSRLPASLTEPYLDLLRAGYTPRDINPQAWRLRAIPPRSVVAQGRDAADAWIMGKAGSGRGARRRRGRSAHSDKVLCNKYHSAAWIDDEGELFPLGVMDGHNDYAESIGTSTDYLLGDGWVRVSTGLDVEGDARGWRENPAPWRRWIELILVCAALNDIRPNGFLYITQSNGRWKQWTVGAAIEHYGTRTQVNDYYSILLGEGRQGRGNLAPTARTAITRKGASAPAKKLVELGLVRGKVLDYGSGRGEDVAWLRSQGHKVSAYDPHHGPKKAPTGTYDTVLSTYVLNVLPPREQLAVIKAVRQRLARGGRAYLTARTDTCPAPSSGVQTCVASVAGGKVVASGSGFRTWEIR